MCSINAGGEIICKWLHSCAKILVGFDVGSFGASPPRAQAQVRGSSDYGVQCASVGVSFFINQERLST